MNILALDTSGLSLSVALTRAETVVYLCTQQNGHTHSESLMPHIDEAFQVGGLAPGAIDCFAVVHGPGSFTGVRIGVSTAKAFAHAAQKPCIGINALEALAAGVPLFDGVLCPLQDARAGQVYCAAFQDGKRLFEDAALPLDVYLRRLAPYRRCCFVGDGAVVHRQKIMDALQDRALFPPEQAMIISAASVAGLAYAKRAALHGWTTLRPYYLRAPQAERERLARGAANG